MSRSKLVFAAVVAAVGLYAWWDFRHLEEEKSKTEKEEKAFQKLEEGAVEEAVWEKNGTAVKVVRKDGNWRLESPVSDLADEGAISTFLGSLLDEKATLVEVESPNWGQYGLEKPLGQVTLRSKTDSETIYVSATEAFDGSRYLKREGEEKLFVGARSWTNHLGKAHNEVRNKRLFPEGKKLLSLDISATGLKLNQEGEKWQLRERKNVLLDEAKVRQLVNAVTELHVLDFVSEKKTPADLHKYHLTNPWGYVLVKIGEKPDSAEEWKLSVSHEKEGSVYLSLNSREEIFKASSGFLSSIKRAEGDLRDLKHPFKVDPGLAQEMIYKTKDFALQLSKKGGRWEFAGPLEENKIFDSEKIKSFLDQIKNLEAKDFVQKSFASGQNKIELQDSEKKTLFEMNWDGQKIKSKDKKTDVILVKTSLSNEAVAVDAGRIQFPSKGELFKDKPKTDEGSKKDEAAKLVEELTAPKDKE